MVEDLIKRLRDDAGLDGQKLLAADLLEQQAARIAELTTCKLCNSTGNSTPCAYPTEINRQQARRLTALESERDALLAAAGKEAVAEPVAWFTDDSQSDRSATTWDRNVADRWRAKGWPVHPLYTAPAAALEHGDGRDAWQPIDTAPKDGRTVLLGYLNSAGKWRTTRGQWMSEEYIAECWEEPDDVEPGWFETAEEAEDMPNCWRIEPTHWQPLPEPPAALSQKAGEQQ